MSYVVYGKWQDELSRLRGSRRTIFLTDKTVRECHSEIFEGEDTIVFDGGEENKTLATYQSICQELLEKGADRSTLLVGVGGGVVTDMAGYVGATYMRGIAFGFVSTTLLGQVDASIGGKNGVNLDGYKNIVGTFTLPEFVVIDSSLLSTLSEDEMRSGFGEVVKYALLDGEELLDDKDYIKKCVDIKLRIVETDFREGAGRKLLNLGHTFGHALEKCSRKYSHGEAVGYGMAEAARISNELGFLSEEKLQRIIALIEKYSLPTTVEIPREELLCAIKKDKKVRDNVLEMILLRDLGSPFIFKYFL